MKIVLRGDWDLDCVKFNRVGFIFLLLPVSGMAESATNSIVKRLEKLGRVLPPVVKFCKPRNSFY